MVPGRVGVQQVAERGEVAAGERAEEGADDIDVGEAVAVAVAVLAVMDGSLAELLGDCPAGTVGNRYRPQLSTVQSILAAAARPVLAARPCRIANIARPARVETPHLA